MSENKVDLVGVQSSNVQAVGYSDQRRLLFVQFKGGGIYQYADVDKAVYDSLLETSSVGKYIHANIKGNYQYKQVDSEALEEKEPEEVEEQKDVNAEPAVVLVDFSWLYYRSKFAHSTLSYEVDGVTVGTGTVHGSYQALSDMFYHNPNAMVYLCLDGKPYRQQRLHPDYKGEREHKRDVEVTQLSRMDIAKAFSLIPRVKLAYSKDMEADDTIAFLAWYWTEKGYPVVIFSGDGDVRQLIDDERNVKCAADLRADGGFTLEDEDHLYSYGIKDLQGLEPKTVPLYLSIVGDDSDTIKGVSGFYKKVAKQLALECKTLQGLKELIERGSEDKKIQKNLDKLYENMSVVERNYKLVKLDPIGLPGIMNQAKGASLDFFTQYGCEQARGGVEKLIETQNK